jgi:LysM repeat protein
MTKKIIKLTEKDLTNIVKRVIAEQNNWWEQKSISEQMKTVKPEMGGKYCFSDTKRKQIESPIKQGGLNDHSYVVYKVKKGDTVDGIANRGNSRYNLEKSNDLCPEIKKNMIKAGDVVIYSLAPSQ